MAANRAAWKARLATVKTDQSDGLPEYNTIQLFATKTLLKEPEQYDAWKTLIVDALQAYRATALIDINIKSVTTWPQIRRSRDQKLRVNGPSH